MADLDHLKAINDRYGHQTGDAVLELTAQRLLGGVRRPADRAPYRAKADWRS